MSNPLMWGIGAGLGAAALHSYLNGPRPAAPPGAPAMGAPLPASPPATISNTHFGSDSDDEDWTPAEVFHGRRNAILSGAEPRTFLEQHALDADGSYTREDIGTGTVSWRSGRANQLFVQSREGDYNDAKVKVDYDDVASILDEGSEREIEERANALLKASLGKNVDFSGWPDAQRRAGSHLLAITQVAEEHSSRTQGSALYARGALQAVADGVMTFMQAFNRSDGAYNAAHHSGTSEMREVAAGTRPVNDHLGGLSEHL